jgi:hypothetical protein
MRILNIEQGILNIELKGRKQKGRMQKMQDIRNAGYIEILGV